MRASPKWRKKSHGCFCHRTQRTKKDVRCSLLRPCTAVCEGSSCRLIRRSLFISLWSGTWLDLTNRRERWPVEGAKTTLTRKRSLRLQQQKRGKDMQKLLRPHEITARSAEERRNLVKQTRRYKINTSELSRRRMKATNPANNNPAKNNPAKNNNNNVNHQAKKKGHRSNQHSQKRQWMTVKKGI